MASDSEPPRQPAAGSGGDAPSGSRPPPARSSPPPPPDGRAHEDGDRKRRFAERVIPVIVKRLVEKAVESGVDMLSEQPENLRNFIADMKLPKEVIADVYGQIDDTKNGLYRVVAKGIRDVLEHTQVADEIVKVLTKLSFEIKTEIRFVPNDAADARVDEDGQQEPAPPVRPKVTSEVTMRERGHTERPRR
jgi:hypothetical protein